MVHDILCVCYLERTTSLKLINLSNIDISNLFLVSSNLSVIVSGVLNLVTKWKIDFVIKH